MDCTLCADLCLAHKFCFPAILKFICIFVIKALIYVTDPTEQYSISFLVWPCCHHRKSTSDLAFFFNGIVFKQWLSEAVV